MIRPEEVRRVAELARLRLAEEDVERLARQLGAVLDFADALNALDLAEDEPTAFAPEETPWREDVVNGRRLDAGLATAGSAASEDGFFLVPPIVENVNP